MYSLVERKVQVTTTDQAVARKQNILEQIKVKCPIKAGRALKMQK